MLVAMSRPFAAEQSAHQVGEARAAEGNPLWLKAHLPYEPRADLGVCFSSLALCMSMNPRPEVHQAWSSQAPSLVRRQARQALTVAPAALVVPYPGGR